MFPIPVKPPFLNSNMIECKKVVSFKFKVLSTKDAYKVLLDKEFAISEEFTYKIELENIEVDVKKSFRSINLLIDIFACQIYIISFLPHVAVHLNQKKARLDAWQLLVNYVMK